jgi:ribonuclease HI
METPRMRRRLKLFFDGGCRPNPGRIEAAVVVRGVTHMFDDLGHGTNSDAEWLALLCALKMAQSLGLGDVTFMGDAAEVIQQVNSALSTGCARHAHAATFLTLAAGMPEARIRWIKREQNLAGIALAARHPR